MTCAPTSSINFTSVHPRNRSNRRQTCTKENIINESNMMCTKVRPSKVIKPPIIYILHISNELFANACLMTAPKCILECLRFCLQYIFVFVIYSCIITTNQLLLSTIFWVYLYFDEINDCIKVHLRTLLMLSTVYLPCKTISVDAVVCICKIFDYMLNCNVLCFSVFQNIALQQLQCICKG